MASRNSRRGAANRNAGLGNPTSGANASERRRERRTVTNRGRPYEAASTRFRIPFYEWELPVSPPPAGASVSSAVPVHPRKPASGRVAIPSPAPPLAPAPALAPDLAPAPVPAPASSTPAYSHDHYSFANYEQPAPDHWPFSPDGTDNRLDSVSGEFSHRNPDDDLGFASYPFISRDAAEQIATYVPTSDLLSFAEVVQEAANEIQTTASDFIGLGLTDHFQDSVAESLPLDSECPHYFPKDLSLSCIACSIPKRFALVDMDIIQGWRQRLVAAGVPADDIASFGRHGSI